MRLLANRSNIAAHKKAVDEKRRLCHLKVPVPSAKRVYTYIYINK